MVLGLGIKVAQAVFKYRKYIYRTLVAQDRAIDKAFKIGGYSRQVRYGARHGAIGGSTIGTLLSNSSPDTPGNDVIKVPKPRIVTPSRTTYKTRYRRSGRKRVRCYDNYRSR